jgi:hypothetical protein
MRAQCDVKPIGDEGDEDMRLDAPLELMIDGAQLQIVLHGFEGGLDLTSWIIFHSRQPQKSRAPIITLIQRVRHNLDA